MDFPLIIEAILDDEARLSLNRQRRQRDHSDLLSLPDYTFKGLYKMSRQTAHELILEVAPHLQNATREVVSIPKKLKICLVLHFLAQGSYQKGCGQDYNFPVCQTSVSNCLHEVINVLNNHLNYYVKFPATPEEKNIKKAKFFNEARGFPGIIGAIDCTQIKIIAPAHNDPVAPAILFYNRKHFYSLNVQIIVGADLRILNINARYPGSVQDAAIWLTSSIKRHLNNLYIEGDQSAWLIGDSGYPLEPYLMTPILRPTTNQEQEYNIAHKSLRNVIERLNGLLKSRFRCLLSARALNYSPETAGKIINSCAILNNFLWIRNDNYDGIIFEPDNEDEDDDANYDRLPDLNAGRNIRTYIIANYF